MKKRFPHILIPLLMIIITTMACNMAMAVKARETPTPQPTATNRPTGTPLPTDTPGPTDTPTPVPDDMATEIAMTETQAAIPTVTVTPTPLVPVSVTVGSLENARIILTDNLDGVEQLYVPNGTERIYCAFEVNASTADNRAYTITMSGSDSETILDAPLFGPDQRVYPGTIVVYNADSNDQYAVPLAPEGGFTTMGNFTLSVSIDGVVNSTIPFVVLSP